MQELFLDFATALLIGTLVGIDREGRKADDDNTGVGGIRTFVLLAMAGAVAAWLSVKAGSSWIFAAATLCVTVLVTAGYVVQTRTKTAGLGLTTEVGAVVVFLLAGTVLFGHRGVGAALGIVAAAVLAYKEPIHGVVSRIERHDLNAVLKLLVVWFIVLPLLPNRAVDPWGALNPYKVGWLVILISGLSLIGYVATRWLGERRGTALTGLFGGLVSSTAVTLTFARRSRETPTAAASLAAGLLLAWGVMFVRVLVEVAVVNRALLQHVVWPMAAMGAAAVAVAAWSFWRARHTDGSPDDTDGDVKLRNPFSLRSAIKFALFFAAVLLAVKFAQARLPGQGLYVVAALAGLTDVDAITLSMADYAKRGGSAEVAAGAITLAAIANTCVKCALTVTLAGGGLRLRAAAATAAILAAGAAAWWFA